MAKNFLFAALAINLVVPFVQAGNQGCTVTRDRNTPLYGKECTKQGKFYLVHTCDTGRICKTNLTNVHLKTYACKLSPSAPTFTQAYKTEANNDATLDYLQKHPSVLKIYAASELDLAEKLTTASQNQELAIVKFSAGQAMTSNNKKENQKVVKALTQKNIKFLYTVEDRKGSESLAAYEVRNGKLINIDPKEAVPHCN